MRILHVIDPSWDDMSAFGGGAFGFDILLASILPYRLVPCMPSVLVISLFGALFGYIGMVVTDNTVSLASSFGMQFSSVFIIFGIQALLSRAQQQTDTLTSLVSVYIANVRTLADCCKTAKVKHEVFSEVVTLLVEMHELAWQSFDSAEDASFSKRNNMLTKVAERLGEFDVTLDITLPLVCSIRAAIAQINNARIAYLPTDLSGDYYMFTLLAFGVFIPFHFVPLVGFYYFFVGVPFCLICLTAMNRSAELGNSFASKWSVTLTGLKTEQKNLTKDLTQMLD